jgi:hypothetical protein
MAKHLPCQLRHDDSLLLDLMQHLALGLDLLGAGYGGSGGHQLSGF